MLGLRIGRPALIATAFLIMAATAQPVASYKEIGTTGTVGSHSLTDQRSSPGADCLYRYQDQGSGWELRRIRVDPPNVRAVSGQGEQEVGWSFTVHRRWHGLSDDPWGDWEQRYTSPVMKATTTPSHDAAFTPMGVRVFAPDWGDDSNWFYKVTVKAFWYRPNGNVMGTATMRVEWFKSILGSDRAKQRWTCRLPF